MKQFSYSFKWSLFSPSALADLATRLITTAGATVGNDPNGVLMTNALTSAQGNLVIAIERDKTNPVTQQIRAKDAERDELVLMIRDVIKANTHNMRQPDKLAAANALFGAYANQGTNITNMGNADESTAVNYLIENFLNSDNRPKCELLGLTGAVETLGRVQNELDALYAQRSRLAPELAKFTISRAVEEAAKAIRAFLGFIDVLVAANDATSAGLREQVDQIMREVETLARSRKSRQQIGEPVKPDEVLKKAA